jgi:hypothetical protein
MEWKKIAEKIRDIVSMEIKDEFRDFKASVSGKLNGFRLAIESINRYFCLKTCDIIILN